MSLQNYQKIVDNDNPPMKQSKVKLKCYGGEILQPCGVAYIKFTTKEGKRGKFEFQIVDTNQRPLISADMCEELKLLMVNAELCSVEEKRTQSLTDKVLKEYGDVFEGLGKLPGKLHLEVDDTIPPVQHMARRVPISLRKELRKKLDEMEAEGKIVKETKPSRWVSHMLK